MTYSLFAIEVALSVVSPLTGGDLKRGCAKLIRYHETDSRLSLRLLRRCAHSRQCRRRDRRCRRAPVWGILQAAPRFAGCATHVRHDIVAWNSDGAKCARKGVAPSPRAGWPVLRGRFSPLSHRHLEITPAASFHR